MEIQIRVWWQITDMKQETFGKNVEFNKIVQRIACLYYQSFTQKCNCTRLVK